MTAVAILVYDGVDELDLFGAHSVLRKASELARVGGRPPLDVRMVAQTPIVRTSGDVRLHIDGRLAELAEADAVVVPGGSGAARAAADTRLCDAVRQCGERGAAIYGICTGSLVIAAAGLATGPDDRLAIHHGKHDLLRQYTTVPAAAGLVRSGRVSTVGGDRQTSVKSVDLAFAVLADHAPDLVDLVSDRMELIPGRGVAGGAESG